jgi:hypothetical protein
MTLLHKARAFWYNNRPGVFSIGSTKIGRRAFQAFGGPSGELRDCEICQRSEWLSRVTRENHFKPHKCPTADVCKERCEKQGDPLWEHWHQDFTYMYRVDNSLNAPKCAFLVTQLTKARFSDRICDQGVINFKRQLAQACQVDMIRAVKKGMGNKYDFMLMMCRPGYRFKRPDIPIIMYAHDLWKQHGKLQETLNRVQPDYFLTPFPSSWIHKYKLPSHTKVRFYCFSASQFFTRPNLSKDKEKMLILAGTINAKIYSPRKKLYDFVETAVGDRATLWKNVGHIRNFHTGPAKTDKLRYLGWWSALLGEHKYAMFGAIADNPQPVFIKHYELLGSGAVPIFPVSPDFKYLGIEPMVHYIPLRTVTTGSDKLHHFFSHYPEYRRIAVNAVKWHKKNADRLLFDRFEDVIIEATSAKYPRRRTR